MSSSPTGRLSTGSQRLEGLGTVSTRTLRLTGNFTVWEAYSRPLFASLLNLSPAPRRELPIVSRIKLSKVQSGGVCECTCNFLLKQMTSRQDSRANQISRRPAAGTVIIRALERPRPAICIYKYIVHAIVSEPQL